MTQDDIFIRRDKYEGDYKPDQESTAERDRDIGVHNEGKQRKWERCRDRKRKSERIISEG